MARPGRASLRILRTVFLFGFLLSLAGVVYLLVDPGGPSVAKVEPTSVVDVPAATVEANRPANAALVTTGFRKTIEQEGRPLFAIAGESLVADRDDNVFLRGVSITVARPDGTYEISSNEAEYNQARGEARLQGDVVVNSPDGLQMFSEWLDLSQNGNLLKTSRGSRFALGEEFEGEAQNFHMDLKEEVIQLRGGVVVRSREGVVPATRLRAQQVVFQQGNRLVRAQGNVVLRRAGDELRSERLSLYLDEVEDIVRYVRALWKVRGLVAGGSVSELLEEPSDESVAVDSDLATGSARFRGASLALAINRRSEVESLDLEGARRSPAVFAADDGSGVTRRISAAGIRVNFENSKPMSIDALGDLELVEFPSTQPDQPLRRATSESLHAEFDASGRLARAELNDRVELLEDGLRASAARADLLILQDRIELVGGPRVEIDSAEGRLDAPTVVYNQKTGLMQAAGGVRSELASSTESAIRGPLGDGSEPIRVESREALLRRGSSEFLFRDEVRAWSGSNVLFADQLRGSADGSQLAAAGSVRSVVPTVGAEVPSPGEGENPPAAEQASPIEITSDLLTYSQESGNLLYEGSVEAHQSARLIRCARLEVLVDDQDEAESMLCLGGAEIVDPAMQRVIKGDRAEYDLSSAEVILYGEPLTLTDPAVGSVSGYRLWFSMESGLFKLGEPGGQTSTDS